MSPPSTRYDSTSQLNDYVLVVDDDPEVRKGVRRLFDRWWPDLEVYTANNSLAGFTVILELGPPRLLICDQHMGDGGPGLRLLDYCAEHHKETRRILLTGHSDGEIALARARHVVVRKPKTEPLLRAIREALGT
jgi:DNA-binding NtrC family response regulator